MFSNVIKLYYAVANKQVEPSNVPKIFTACWIMCMKTTFSLLLKELVSCCKRLCML